MGVCLVYICLLGLYGCFSSGIITLFLLMLVGSAGRTLVFHVMICLEKRFWNFGFLFLFVLHFSFGVLRPYLFPYFESYYIFRK